MVRWEGLQQMKYLSKDIDDINYVKQTGYLKY